MEPVTPDELEACGGEPRDADGRDPEPSGGEPRGAWARLRRWLSRGPARRIMRYSVGSVVATVASQLTFLVLYAVGTGPRVASVVGFMAGMLPNYHLNRRWAWQREGSSSWLREVLPYVVVVLVSLGLVTAGTELAEARIVRLELARELEVLAVTAAFAAVNGVLFVAKYLIYDRWLFGRRSRSQVPTNTRA